MTSPESPPQVLLVEGRHDERVVFHLRQRAALQLEFGISAKGSVEQVLDSIRLEVRASGRRTVGILVDADDAPTSRWQSIRDRLQSAGVAAPAQIASAGTIVQGDPEEGRPRVGIWLWPDNESPGELEDFVASMIPGADPVWPLAQDYIAGIPEGDRKFASGKILRAEVYAWLAARKEPRQMGSAINSHDLDIDVERCRTFLSWLRELFGE